MDGRLDRQKVQKTGRKKGWWERIDHPDANVKIPHWSTRGRRRTAPGIIQWGKRERIPGLRDMSLVLSGVRGLVVGQGASAKTTLEGSVKLSVGRDTKRGQEKSPKRSGELPLD